MNVVSMMDTEPSLEKREGPGSRLHQARLAKGLELSLIANRMHLAAETVEALERDDYDRLPGPVFIRGYLKNYARVLGIDAEPLLSAYARFLPADGMVPPLVHGSRIKMGVSGGRWLVPVLIGFLMSLVVIGLIVWWQWDRDWPWAADTDRLRTSGNLVSEASHTDRSQPVAETMRWADTKAPEATEKPPETVIMAETSEWSQQALAVRTVTAETERPQPVAVETEPRATEIPPIASQPVVASPSSGVTPPAATPPGQPELAVAPSPSMSDSGLIAALPVQQPLPSGDQSVVEFSFSGSCWLDIRDVGGKQKIIGVMSKGTRRRLIGQPPFSVVLGNVQVVKVSVDGQPFDITPYARGKVARFNIGEQ